MIYLIAIETSGHAMFRTYPFKTLFICSMQYIHHVCTQPHKFNSSTKWETRCVITSKNVGDFVISNMHKTITTSSHKVSISIGSNTLEHMHLKTQLKHMIAIHVLLIRMGLLVSPIYRAHASLEIATSDALCPPPPCLVLLQWCPHSKYGFHDIFTYILFHMHDI
jgi:hypothetical protein